MNSNKNKHKYRADINKKYLLQIVIRTIKSHHEFDWNNVTILDCKPSYNKK